MKAVIQRVSGASVAVDEKTVGSCGRGYMILLGVSEGDTELDAELLCRKIANLLLGDIYGEAAVVADTHCIRICGRLGFYPEDLKDPVKVEKIMSGYLAPEEQSDFCHRIVQFGRDVCIARAPKCGECPLAEICEGKRI